MTPGVSTIDLAELSAFLARAEGLPCWRAYTSAGNSPGICLGKRVPRPEAEAMRSRPRWRDLPLDSDRFFTSEAQFIIWCTWRLDSNDRPISSSDDAEESASAAIKQLAGTSLQSAKVNLPAGDLELLFSNAQRLRVFCDHVPGDPSFDGNWELFLLQSHVMVGPGAVCRYSDSDDLQRVPDAEQAASNVKTG